MGAILANGGVEEDARKLLAVLAGKAPARGGGPVSAGPEDAAAVGFGTGPSDERLHRAVWSLIASGQLEAVLEPTPTPDDRTGTGALYRVTRTGPRKAPEG